MRRYLLLAVLAVVAIGVTVAILPDLSSHLLAVQHVPAFLAVGMLRPLRLIPKDYDTLNRQSKPGTAVLPEAVPWYFFHRKTYVAAGQVQLAFFDQTEADPGLSNMDQAGQFGTPQFLEVFSIHFAVNGGVTAAAAAAGALDDEVKIRRVGRGRWLLVLSGKNYGEWPLNVIGPAGNPYGVTASPTSTAPATVAETVQLSGWLARYEALDPIVTIAPTVPFRVFARWNAAQAISVDTIVESGFYGVFQRKVA